MWECKKCQTRLEDSFDACWKCGTSKEGVEDPTFAGRVEVEPEQVADAEAVTAGPPSRRRRRRSRAEAIEQLIFVGLNGYALALDRDTGDIVWSNNQMRSGYVSLLIDGDRLIVSTNGYMYCLDPLTGAIMWHNPLTGYGQGPAAVTSVRGQSSSALIQQASDISRRTEN
jgi:hypothetical protein